MVCVCLLSPHRSSQQACQLRKFIVIEIFQMKAVANNLEMFTTKVAS